MSVQGRYCRENAQSKGIVWITESYWHLWRESFWRQRRVIGGRQEHTMKSVPMHIDNVDYQIGDIRSHAAGKFKAFLSDQDVAGTISG